MKIFLYSWSILFICAIAPAVVLSAELNMPDWGTLLAGEKGSRIPDPALAALYRNWPGKSWREEAGKRFAGCLAVKSDKPVLLWERATFMIDGYEAILVAGDTVAFFQKPGDAETVVVKTGKATAAVRQEIERFVKSRQCHFNDFTLAAHPPLCNVISFKAASTALWTSILTGPVSSKLLDTIPADRLSGYRERLALHRQLAKIDAELQRIVSSLKGENVRKD